MYTNFEDVILDIENLVGMELQAINPMTPDIVIESWNINDGKYIVKQKDSNKTYNRNFKEIQTIFLELTKNGYCSVEQALQGSYSSRHHPETIFCNLPSIQYFKFERRKHLILRQETQHSYGEIQELPAKEQRSVKASIVAQKKFSQIWLARELANISSKLHSEVDQLHLASPGVLIDTNLSELIERFDYINDAVQATSIRIDTNQNEFDLHDEDVLNKDVDLSDLVDLSSITGIDDGNTSDSINSLDDDEDTTKPSSELSVPNIRRQTPSLSLLYERLKYGEIEIQPEYQRKDRIWDSKRKSKLIESILMGLPLPIFYFGERKNDDWAVIDGLQRLTTIQDFMKGDFQLKLEKESPVMEADGKSFKEFDRKLTRLINEYEITAYVIDINDEIDESGSSNRFIIELFHRINTYGVKLSEQEIRSAINFGNSVYYLKFLASSATFLEATTNTVNPKRQKDLELCLSGLAFIIFGYKSFDTIKYSDYLSQAMVWINRQDFQKIKKTDGEEDYVSESPTIISLTSKFESSLKLCHEIFGNDAFKKVRGAIRKEPISKPLFEVLVTLFAHADNTQKEQIKQNRDSFVEELYLAIKNDSQKYAEWTSESYNDSDRGLEYSLSTSTGKKATVLYRFEAIANILKNTTGCEIYIRPLSVPVTK
ncbi:DUF262 domain-containing protein [Thiomicrospira sp. S5]|uniref:DUF262 domain-containing protein n=1 Tax=Thiomicrospira sp. S5 TaxID=1803865 RepID=UPI000F8A0216|nr:DUF262 domain-containing protein [Thiomicrospira sp. S5]AZR82961.1 hypothetical protein AYJ59_12175 [Thiomicrospira sp. S5]